MDFSNSIRKSFKSHGSYKHSRRISAGEADDSHHEQLPILSDHAMRTSLDLSDHPEVIVKIDGGDQSTSKKSDNSSSGSNIWRESSYEFWKDGESGGGGGFNFPAAAAEDPPSRLISQFLSRQRDSGGEMSLDVDLEMDEIDRDQNHRSLPPIAETPRILDDNNRVANSKEVKVSFEPDIVEKRREDSSSDDEMDEVRPQQYRTRRRSSNVSFVAENNNDVNDNGGGGGEVLKCTSFQRRASMLRTKTKSRFDTPEYPERRSGKSGPIRSGMLGMASGMLGKNGDEDEEDPWFDDDVPEDFKKGNLNALTLVQWISLLVIVAALTCTLAIPIWKRRGIRGLALWKWEVLVLVLICGRLVSGWGIRLVVFFIERNFLLRKRVLYFVYGIRKAVQNCIWLGLVLIAWHYMFDKKVEGNNKFLRFVNKVMVCMLVTTLLWLVKTLMVKVLASSFHVSTFFDRIQESLFNQYVIETLSGPPLIEDQGTLAEIKQLENAGAKMTPELRKAAFQSKSVRVVGRPPAGGASIQYSRALSKKQEEGIPIDHLHKWNPKNISAWNMKRLMNMVRHGSLSTLDEQLLDSKKEDESAKQIRSECEAKVAARKIFFNVAKDKSKYIFLRDLMRFLREEEALKTMSLIEGSSESEKISKSSLKNWVVNAFRERRALALTLNDTKTAVNKLHQMVNVLVGIIILVICLVILGIASSKVLLFISSQIVVVAFVFGNTCKTIFEALIFLFVMHPFDVGDRCEIDGVQMIVEEMNILTTVFLRFDNQKIMYPNSTLATKPISNYYRSPDMGDSVDFSVHIATPAEKIAIIRQRIISFVDSKKDHWYSSPTIVLMNLEDLNRLKFAVWLRHRINHQDMGTKWSRRALVVEEMVRVFKELDIEYRLYPLDINVRTMPAANSTRLPSTWADSA
ncbi:hypothetical protein RJ640_026870 [Escallonia rubra]|uniref:Mechanosensitive ion channel protein n=1 Tax=Escallonia rubra TaxID=112253 RepID=A0AA88U7L6_9ASTE|nr:hypothetical protein RJ640_026870 [Escallonia rubra]